MIKPLVVVLLAHQSLCLSPKHSSILYEEVFTYHNETAFKAEFAFLVVDKIYNAFRQWFFTIIFCEFTYFENRILKYTETKDYGYPVVLLNGCASTESSYRVKPKINKDGVTAYVVTSNDMSVEVNENSIRALVRTGVFQPRFTVIFVINVPVITDQYFYYAMLQHFQLLRSSRITNSVLLVWSDDKLRMFTYNHYFEEVRDITDEKDVSRLLTRQYNNLYGHTLRLSVFRKVYISDEVGPVTCDARFATTVMSYLNASCLPLTPRDGNTVGDLLDNGTATGVTADLMDGYTDLELSSRVLKNSYYGYIDTTYPLMQDDLCFLVKKSDKETTFAVTIQLISVQMLLVFMFNVVFLTTLAILSRKLEENILNLHEKQTACSTTMDMVKCFLRQTFDIKFIGPVFRLIVLIIILYSLVIDCVIDGIITSAITNPRYRPELDTLDDLIYKTNLTFGVHNRHMKLVNKSIPPDKFKLIKHRLEIVNDKEIKEIVEKRKFQYAILLRKSDTSLITRKLANMKDGRPIYHTALECPIPCSIVYGLRHGSPLLPRINNLLHHLNQAGILMHWDQSDEYTLFQNLGKNFNTGDGKGKKPLNLENLRELFLVFGIGLLISFIAFIFEISIIHCRSLVSHLVKDTQ